MQELANVNTETVATLQYMAPEAMSQSVYSKASDIYAFGILAFEIVFEKTAFGGLEGFQLIDAVVNKKKTPVMQESEDLKEVCEIIENCWKFCPEERLEAGVVCKGLMKVLKGLKKKNSKR
jgi:serine/threonine protein kinase